MSLRSATAALRRLRALQAECALAGARLWDQPSPQTSQAVAVRTALRPGLLSSLILGGNRSGKTEAGAMIAAAYAMGRDHPAVITWGARNGLDLSAIQSGPGRVCASSLSSGDSLEYVRPKVARYLPAGSTWTNRHGKGSAVARIPGGGVILFKSNDQGARAYQGASWHLLWMDEEHDHAVFREARMRLADHAGLALFSMTPLKGKTWVWSMFVDARSREPDCAFYAINSIHNPHRSPGYLERLLATYGSHERAARERGEFTALEGRVYESWRHDLHVIPARPIPVAWPRYQAGDVGVRNPTAVLWLAVDPGDQVVHVYREHYAAGLTTHENARRVLAVELCPGCAGSWFTLAQSDETERWARLPRAERHRLPHRHRGHRGAVHVCPDCALTDHPGRTEPEPLVRWIDPAAADARLTLQHHHDLDMRAANNAVREGLSAVSALLSPDAAGRAHLLVHDSCAHTIEEIAGYVWDTTRSRGDAPDRPLKRNDHAMDALRYAVRGLMAEGEITVFDAV